jgi:hypothetical protein
MSISSLGKPFKATKDIDLGMMQVLGVHTTWSPYCPPQLQTKSLQTIWCLYIWIYSAFEWKKCILFFFCYDIRACQGLGVNIVALKPKELLFQEVLIVFSSIPPLPLANTSIANLDQDSLVKKKCKIILDCE